MRFHDSVCIGWFVIRTTPELTPSVSVSLYLSLHRVLFLSVAVSTIERHLSRFTFPPIRGAASFSCLHNHCQWYHMGGVTTHNSRIGKLRIFIFGGEVSHMIRHVRPLTEVKRSKVT